MSESELRARRLIVFAVVALVGGTALAWALFLVRDALQLVYLSIMLALGFSPTVSWIERRRWFGRKKGLPRWVAILIFYVALFASVALLLEIILPPLIEQSSDLWSKLPEYLNRSQSWMVSHRLLKRAFTLAELVEKAPSPNAAVSGILGVVNSALGVVLAGFTYCCCRCICSSTAKRSTRASSAGCRAIPARNGCASARMSVKKSAPGCWVSSSCAC